MVPASDSRLPALLQRTATVAAPCRSGGSREWGVGSRERVGGTA